MREHLAVRRASPCTQAHEQRALKPAAMLVAALEVHVRGPRQVGPSWKDRFMARAGVEPHVEDVALRLEGRAAAGGARQSCRQELFDRPLVPRVRPILVKNCGGSIDKSR